LSVIERLPEPGPPLVGVNVIATVQDPEAETELEVEHVVVDAAIPKGPETRIAAKLRLVLPLLTTVTPCDGLVVPTGSGGKAGDADKLTAGAAPVPIKLTICGLPLALSVSVRLPERVPAAVGVNATSITQLLLVASGALIVQVVPLAATEKSPVATILAKLRDTVPLLVTVTGLGALVVPTG
jgi:hypothetical protein